MEALCLQVWPHPPGSSSGEPKLCGFLLKQGGALKAWKQRWFSYQQKQNQLLYFRSPQDVTPLGRVDLSGATFSYPLSTDGGTFHIQTPERTFVLKVGGRGESGRILVPGDLSSTRTSNPQQAMTQELMLYWLQQLQLKRWRDHLKSTSPDQTGCSSTAGEEQN